jgi:hypothetical protein
MLRIRLLGSLCLAERSSRCQDAYGFSFMKASGTSVPLRKFEYIDNVVQDLR